jgi:ribosomal-protein-alanine N-acetyltransferase
MLFLRKPTANDEPEIRACYSRSTSLHQPWTYEPKDYPDYLAQPERHFLCLENTGEIVGSFNISNIVRGYFHSAYLGYEVFVPHQGKGYMRTGLELLLDHAFSKLNLHRLEANVQPGNTRSIQLLERAGFVKEGYSRDYLNIGNKGWRDHERWAIINDSWKNGE